MMDVKMAIVPMTLILTYRYLCIFTIKFSFTLKLNKKFIYLLITPDCYL